MLDADALTSFAGDAGALATLTKVRAWSAVITPHEGEFAKLFNGKRTSLTPLRNSPPRARGSRRRGRSWCARGRYRRRRARRAGDDRRRLPPTLGTAGSGDVLAGLIGGLLAQGMPGFEAASAAVWLHGAAARAFGPGLIAEDLPEMLPAVLAGLGEALGD